MITVRIVNDFKFVGGMKTFFKNNIPVVDGVEFTNEDVPSDYIIVWCNNMYKNEVVLNHDPSRVWVIVGEPDTEVFGHLHRRWQNVGRVYGYSDIQHHSKYVNEVPFSRWFVGKTYDEIMAYSGEDKQSGVGFVTSNKGFLAGHKKRMNFLETIKPVLGEDLHLAGNGFKHLNTKWDGVAPYKYNLAIDNYITKYGVDEKVMDCWAGLSLPLYYGSPEIHKYFPEKSFIRIDIEDKFVGEKIKEIIHSDLYEERLSYILEAREITLNRHNMFNRLARAVKEYDRKNPIQPAQEIILEKSSIKYPLMARIKSKINKIRAK